MARASITKRTRYGRVFYELVVGIGADAKTGDMQSRSFSYRTKKEAQLAQATWLSNLDKGTAVDRSKKTVAEVLTLWLETYARYTVRASSFTLYESLIRYHLIPGLGSILVQQLTPDQVQAFYSRKLQEGTGARTVQLCHVRLRQALKQALKLGLVSRNVTDAVTPPRVQQKEMRTWSVEDARRFLSVAPESHHGPLWIIALATGMRRGELLGLRWKDVDLAGGAVTVQQTVGVLAGAPEIRPPKSKSATRRIPISEAATAVLRAHKVTQLERRLAMGELWQDYDLVFATGIGTPINPNNLARDFNALVAKAGVPRIRIHDLRHSHVTLAILQGANVKAVSQRVGHARTSITMDIYAHALPEMHEEVSTKIGALLFEGHNEPE